MAFSSTDNLPLSTTVVCCFGDTKVGKKLLLQNPHFAFCFQTFSVMHTQFHFLISLTATTKFSISPVLARTNKNATTIQLNFLTAQLNITNMLLVNTNKA